jgi:hypothetical protein
MSAIIPGQLEMNEPEFPSQMTLDLILDEACRKLPGGGDHTSRRQVAERIMETFIVDEDARRPRRSGAQRRP